MTTAQKLLQIVSAIGLAAAAAMRMHPAPAPNKEPSTPQVSSVAVATPAQVFTDQRSVPLAGNQRPIPASNTGIYSGASTVEVSGYRRSNGTYVQPYSRTRADITTDNNWSHEGNINPVTGAKGYHK